jgi:hypothetical protein
MTSRLIHLINAFHNTTQHNTLTPPPKKQDLASLGRTRFFSSSSNTNTNTNAPAATASSSSSSLDVRVLSLGPKRQAALASLGPAVSSHCRRLYHRVDGERL